MKKIAVALGFLSILLTSCTAAQIQAGRDQVAWSESRNCRRIETRVTRVDKKGYYRTIGYDYTTVCD